jgi:all-trans-retinol dehydrogenase (NAD+)
MATLRIGAALGILIDAVKNAALEPALTGPLLLALTRGPPWLQEYLLRPLARTGVKPEQLIRSLKLLFALGVVGGANKFLNDLARNHWRLRKQGVPWDFTSQRELCVVTGGCSGFGYLISKGLAAKTKLVVIDIQELPADLKDASIHYYKCDITSASAVSETASRIREEVGVPTILINNAGVATAHTILETSEEWLEKIFRVNLMSHFTLIKEFLPGMLQQKKGHIVAIASMASYFSGASLVDYCCTKAGVLALHEGTLPTPPPGSLSSHISLPYQKHIGTSTTIANRIIGLNSELKTRYADGRCIQTTIVHPMWAQTPLIKDWESSLVASKTFVLPPSAIANPVVKQVLSGKSGQLYVPEGVKKFSGIRGWPAWLQEQARGGVAGATKPKG